MMIILIQPPFVQLNSPYPSLYYLKTFLSGRGHNVIVRDHSIGLFEKIFCAEGLRKIFSDAEAALPSAVLNDYARAMAERFISEAESWIHAIASVTAYLRGADHEWSHLAALANGTLPSGPRVDALLASHDGELNPGDAPRIAAAMLEDLADFITAALDPAFSLVRYVPRAAGVYKRLDDFLPGAGRGGYVVEQFYRPYLETEWDNIERDMPGGAGEPFLLGLTVPFPGCLAAALACAASAKRRFGGKVTVAMGGGYVNTELRFLNDAKFYGYVDRLIFDRGYGELAALAGETLTDDARRVIDDSAARDTFPDYSDVDFSRYLCVVDDANAMHRLWSDGRWLKGCLAHGCYWHSCAFCDVSLDYIRSFIPAGVKKFFGHFCRQADATGVRGVHLVDEAAPVSSLVELALLNRAAGLPLRFWGNIRFEKAFDADTAALLAAGGLIGVSAGIEVASERGFKRIGKGIGLKDVVSSCAAFKEAGILTHAYLIYGYWDEDEQEIVDSAETLRQLFAAGLLDSAFWHKFVLTRHSRVYAEWERGRLPELKPLGLPADGETIFALNDLSFAGEEKYDRYTEGLDRLLAAWMAGDCSARVNDAFPFTVAKPGVDKHLVDKLIDSYARARDDDRAAAPRAGDSAAYVFLGSRPIIRKAANGAELFWRRRLEDHTLRFRDEARAAACGDLLREASRGNGMAAAEFLRRLETAAPTTAEAWPALRAGGLVRFPPVRSAESALPAAGTGCSGLPPRRGL